MTHRALRVVACVAALGLAGCDSAPGTDAALAARVTERLRSDAVVGGNDVTVRAEDGRITLGGAVETPDRRERAEKLARSVRGVREIANEIQLRPPPPPGTPDVSARPAPPPPAPGSTGNPPVQPTP